MDVDIARDRNKFEVRYGGGAIYLEASGFDPAPDTPADFALWLMLPLAMRAGGRLHIRASVDPVSLSNARALVRIWTMWLPEVYRPIEVSAENERTAASSPAASASVLLFSGGVDSTYALLSEKDSKTITHALTVHGLDYSDNDDELFRKLREKTRPLLQRYSVTPLSIRTNAGRQVRQLGLTHGFVLASCLFLCAGRFASGLLAADITPAQDMMAFPWGTNHVTNGFYASSQFRMETVSQHATRIQKLAHILGDATALHAVSFCSVKKMRPDNCGVCPKCLRTKAMLLALMGSVPDIFLDRRVTAEHVRKLDVSSPAAYKHYFEILEVARARGFLDRIPGLERHVAESLAARRRRALIAKRLQKVWPISLFNA